MVVDNSEAFIAEEVHVETDSVFPKLLRAGIVPQLNVEVELEEVPDERVAVAGSEPELAAEETLGLEHQLIVTNVNPVSGMYLRTGICWSGPSDRVLSSKVMP